MKKPDKSELFRALIPVGIALLGGLIGLGGMWLSENLRLRDADSEEREIALPAASPGEGVGRLYSAERYLGAAEEEKIPTLWIACEYDDPLPEWWDPEGADIVWDDHSADVGKMVAEDIYVPDKNVGKKNGAADTNVGRKDGCCPDWNYNTSLVGWGGRRMEAWEFDLFVRVFYLEFWGTSEECCEAGCDAILNLWASGLYGRTMGECLAFYDEKYGWAYTTYPEVWLTKYDTDGLAWCREFCRARFEAGPVWAAMYFQLGGFHDPEWATPAYKLDTVYFSTAKEG